jgi:hypothetical protein
MALLISKMFRTNACMEGGGGRERDVTLHTGAEDNHPPPAVRKVPLHTPPHFNLYTVQLEQNSCLRRIEGERGKGAFDFLFVP